MLAIKKTRTNHLADPIGIDTTVPRLSWIIVSDKRNTKQTAYQIQASHDAAFSEIIYDSGKTEFEQCIAVPYSGPVLTSKERVYWHVKVWSIEEESDYCPVNYFEMGLLKLSDWRAKWIEMEKDVDPGKSNPEPIIRKAFLVKPDLAKARIYSTAHGVYSFKINGNAATEDMFLPGRTVYTKRLQYQTYDITTLLQEGENVLSVMFGDGWWRGAVGAQSNYYTFGYKLAFLGQIALTYSDGTEQIIASDRSFKYSAGPLLKSDTKCGEIYDARLVQSGWDKPGFDDSSWKNVWEVDCDLSNLVATSSVPVRTMESFSPAILNTPDGNTVLDFGQNIAGFMEMKVLAPSGTKIVMEYSEVLDSHGNFTAKHYIMPSADGRTDSFQREEYICQGGGIEHYAPQFGVYGFRYVLLNGYPGPIDPANFTAYAVYSSMETTGNFACSEPLFNQLIKNCSWSPKGNFLEIPTDCPTRERAGWSGDAQVYCKTATDFMDTYTFYEKWMQDVAADQTPSGKIMAYSPASRPYHLKELRRLALIRGEKDNEELAQKLQYELAEGGFMDGCAGWSDAITIIPWTVYEIYGDKQIIINQYDSAIKWVNYIITNAKKANPYYKDELWYANGDDASFVWDTCFHWGEFLEPDSDLVAGSEDGFSMEKLYAWIAERTKTGDPTVATAFFARSAELVANMAKFLDKSDDFDYYSKLHQRIKEVYNKYFIKEDGSILEGRQAPLARALAFGLVNSDKLQMVAARLNQYVINNGYHLNTGFLSTPFLLGMLARNGYEDTAYKILEQKDFPSWLFQVEHGATTICEHWNAYKPGTEPGASCNHYSFGAVCDFMFSDIAGIRILKPGYKEFLVQPTIGSGLTWAKAEYISPYGIIRSEWRIDGPKTIYCFEVPVNTSAHIHLRTEEGALDAVHKLYSNAKYENGFLCFTIGSGIYEVVV